jgi:hypothetical protein
MVCLSFVRWSLASVCMFDIEYVSHVFLPCPVLLLLLLLVSCRTLPNLRADGSGEFQEVIAGRSKLPNWWFVEDWVSRGP